MAIAKLNFGGGGNIVNPLAQFGQTLSNTGRQYLLDAENKRQQELANERADANLLLQQAAVQRADKQLKMQQATNKLALDKFDADQAAKDQAAYTAGVIGRVAAAPQEKRQNVLSSILKTEGGFAPSAQDTVALERLLTAPTTKYSSAKFYKVNNGAVESVASRSPAEEKAFLEAGYTRGSYKAPSEDGSGSSSTKKATLDKAWNGVYDTINKANLDTALTGKGDTHAAIAVADKVRGVGISPEMFTGAFTKMMADRDQLFADKRFTMDDLNTYLPPANINGKLIPIGTAITLAEENGATLFYDQTKGVFDYTEPKKKKSTDGDDLLEKNLSSTPTASSPSTHVTPTTNGPYLIDTLLQGSPSTHVTPTTEKNKDTAVFAGEKDIQRKLVEGTLGTQEESKFLKDAKKEGYVEATSPEVQNTVKALTDLRGTIKKLRGMGTPAKSTLESALMKEEALIQKLGRYKLLSYGPNKEAADLVNVLLGKKTHTPSYLEPGYLDAL